MITAAGAGGGGGFGGGGATDFFFSSGSGSGGGGGATACGCGAVVAASGLVPSGGGGCITSCFAWSERARKAATSLVRRSCKICPCSLCKLQIEVSVAITFLHAVWTDCRT